MLEKNGAVAEEFMGGGGMATGGGSFMDATGPSGPIPDQSQWTSPMTQNGMGTPMQPGGGYASIGGMSSPGTPATGASGWSFNR